MQYCVTVKRYNIKKMKLEQTILLYRCFRKEYFHYFDKVGFLFLAKEEADEDTVGR